MNIINGGVHASSGLEIQEFMIVPKQSTFKERLRCGSGSIHTLKLLAIMVFLHLLVMKVVLHQIYILIEEALDYVVKAISDSNYVPGKDMYCPRLCSQ